VADVIDSSDIEKLEEEMLNFFEDMMYDRGGSPLLGRIYGSLVLSHDALKQKELGDKFKVNASTISRNLKELEEWRLIGRRREPGSREWVIVNEPTSFLELLVSQFEEQVANLKDRKDALIRIQGHWGEETMGEQSRKSPKGKRILEVLTILTEWIELAVEELESTVQDLHSKFLALEKKFH
jgi:DNA-binding transcriptional regulator GbsR (MarR family)